MIIVMILIATITGALAFNYQKSLDKGRIFASKQKAERLQTILTLYFSEHPDKVELGIGDNVIGIINDSGLGPPNAKDLLKDEFGESFAINLRPNEDGTICIQVSSKATMRAS